MYETEHMQVTEKHFEDLVYIYTNVETSSVQIVYTDSKNDREGLVVSCKPFERALNIITFICMDVKFSRFYLM